MIILKVYWSFICNYQKSQLESGIKDVKKEFAGIFASEKLLSGVRIIVIPSMNYGLIGCDYFVKVSYHSEEKMKALCNALVKSKISMEIEVSKMENYILENGQKLY